MAEAAGASRRALTGRERRILDMWPRFEDGEPVEIGDGAVDGDGERFTVLHIEAAHRRWMLKGPDGQGRRLVVKPGERVKRPEPEVLDAHGVPIRVGEGLHGLGREQHTFEVIDPHHVDPELGGRFSVRCRDLDEGGEKCHCIPQMLTHTLPDSWERLVEDM